MKKTQNKTTAVLCVLRVADYPKVRDTTERELRKQKRHPLILKNLLPSDYAH